MVTMMKTRDIFPKAWQKESPAGSNKWDGDLDGKCFHVFLPIRPSGSRSMQSTVTVMYRL
jgi:hypothetical protein